MLALKPNPNAQKNDPFLDWPESLDGWTEVAPALPPRNREDTGETQTRHRQHDSYTEAKNMDKTWTRHRQDVVDETQTRHRYRQDIDKT